jgi:hypothetical protein
MKTPFIYLFIALWALVSCKATNKPDETKLSDFDLILMQKQADSLLLNIQQKINNSFIQSNISQSDRELTAIERQLYSVKQVNNSPLIDYWYAYTCYYHTIFCYTSNDTKNAELIVNKGIDCLENIKNKSSEHYALLALLQSFAIQFAPGMKAPFISKKIKQNGQQALEMDSTNLRAWFVLGSSDFYTPEKYGGGKIAESYLQKAICLKDQTVENPYMPSWGRNSAYELLIRLYIGKNQMDLAKQYYLEAHRLFPNDYMISKLANELINK